MGSYLNPGNEKFFQCINSEIYVDKTGLIGYCNRVMNSLQKQICVSRPRRFGKSVTADMLTAYYSRGCDSAELFAPYEIAQTETFEALKAYQGNLLLVGISYDKRTKKHICVMEEMQKEQEQRIYGVFILF